MKLDEPDLRVGDLLVRKDSEQCYCLVARRGDKLDVCHIEDTNALFPFLFDAAVFRFPMSELNHMNTEQFRKHYMSVHGKDLPRKYDMQKHKWVLDVGREDPTDDESNCT